MKSSNKEEIINHNAIQLFDIVLDLDNYPKFIPWCKSMEIHSKTSTDIYADMHVVYKLFFPQKFGSHVIYDRKKLIIKTIYLSGPLKDLKTHWKFKAINNNKTLITFNVNFEFKKFLHQKLAETFYPLIENKMINSFKERANIILN